MTPAEIYTEEFLIEHYINQQKSSLQIARETNAKSVTSVEKYLKKYNIKREHLNKIKNNLLSKDFLDEQYNDLNKSLEQIAQENNVHRSTVLKKMKEHDIKRRIGKNPNPQMSKKCNLAGFTMRFKGYEGIPGYYLYRLKRATEEVNRNFEVTPKFLWELFLKQNKKCAISGIEIKFCPINEPHDRKDTTASLDRIDSSKGYTEDNVQWVHKKVNSLKSNFTDKEFIEWCKIITDYQREIELS